MHTARDVAPLSLIVQLVQAHIVESKAQQGVLDDSVVNVVLTALGTQSGILCTVIPL